MAENTINDFISSIQDNKQAFDVFRLQAQRRGLMQVPKPLMHQQTDYYERFIAQPRSYSSNNLNRDTSPKRKVVFTPLKDLLTKSHEDRVRDYMKKMEGTVQEHPVQQPVQLSIKVKKKTVDVTQVVIAKKAAMQVKRIIEEVPKERKQRKESKREKQTVNKNVFKIAKNDKLKQYFEKVAGTDRMTKARLIEFLASRYPFEPHDLHGVYPASISYSMVKQLWLFLDSSGSDLKYEQFYDKLERWMNQDDPGLKRFVFDIYDCNGWGKITERSLFKTVLNITRKTPNVNMFPTDLLSLQEYETDMFMTIFYQDFLKISQALKVKSQTFKVDKKAKPKEELFIDEDHEFNIELLMEKYQNLQFQPPQPDEAFLTFEDFCAIDFGFQEGDRFLIINDVLTLLTGVKHANQMVKPVKPHRNSQNKVYTLPSHGIEDELRANQQGISAQIMKSLENAFKKLWGFPDNIQPGSEQDGILYLTEQNFTNNLKFLILSDCKFYGKMLYLYFADGYDQAKISFAQFVLKLKPFCIDEERQRHNKTSFQILDIDRDNQLNIVNLLHLFRNLPSNSKLGQEIFKVIDYFIQRNHDKSELSQVKISFDLYMKINNDKTCLTQEIRQRFLGIHLSNQQVEESDIEELTIVHTKSKRGQQHMVVNKRREDRYVSIVALVDDPDFDKSANKKFLFDNIDLKEDTSAGLRGFDRNIDRLGNQLIQFYRGQYPKDAKKILQQFGY